MIVCILFSNKKIFLLFFSFVRLFFISFFFLLLLSRTSYVWTSEIFQHYPSLSFSFIIHTHTIPTLARLFSSLYFFFSFGFVLLFSKKSVYIYICMCVCVYFFLLLHFFPYHRIKTNKQRLYLFHVFFFFSFFFFRSSVTNFKQTKEKTKQ